MAPEEEVAGRVAQAASPVFSADPGEALELSFAVS